MSEYINVNRWDNARQGYVAAGTLVYSSEHSGGTVSFHYDEAYLKRGGAPLDPKNLPTDLPQGTYVAPGSNGKLPRYFQQFLPSLHANALLSDYDFEWTDLNQFSRLMSVTRHTGDYGAIQLNAQNDQDNAPVQSLDELNVLVQSIRRSQAGKGDSPLTPQLYIALCKLPGRQIMLDYVSPDNGKRCVVKMANNALFDDVKMRAVVTDMQRMANIDACELKMQALDTGELVALQEDFTNAFEELPGGDEPYLIKFNRVSFSTLLYGDDEVKAQNGYSLEQAVDVIETYSSDPDSDLTQLYLRTILNVAINNCANGPEDMHLLDVTSNIWRLAPLTNALPNPLHQNTFAMQLGEGMSARQFLKVDNQLFSHLATVCSIPHSQSLELAHGVMTAVESWGALAEKHNLDAQSRKALQQSINQGASTLIPTHSISHGTSPGM